MRSVNKYLQKRLTRITNTFPEKQDIQLDGMQANQRDRHCVVWNPEDPEVENIQLAGMQETKRNKTFSWQESRGSRGTGHSAGWNAGDQEKQDI